MLPPLFCSFSVHFAQKHRFQQKLLLYRLFKISLISVVRSLDKVCDLPKHGRENKKGDPSVDVIDSLKKCLIPASSISYSFSSEFVVRINFYDPFLSSWNTTFQCSHSDTLSNLFRKYLTVFLDILLFM